MRWNPLFRDYAVIAEPPAGAHVPAAGRPVPAVPVARRQAHRDPRRRLRGRGVREPLPVPLAAARPTPCRWSTSRRSAPGPAPAAARSCASPAITTRPFAAAVARARAHGHRRVGRPHPRAVAIDSIDYVFCFENRGEEIGVTLSHPHGQIYGYPFVPPRFYKTGEALRHHRERTGRCLQCDLLARRVSRTARGSCASREHWVGLRAVRRALALRGPARAAPARARPARADRRRARRPRRDLPGRAARLRPALRHPDALHRRLAAGAGAAATATCGTSAPRSSRSAARPGKLKYLAGSESGAAVWINDVAPEDAAARLRAAIG